MKQHDLAVRLLATASQDEVVVDRLSRDATVEAEVIGFHLQQAAQKLIKAVLAE